MISILLACSYHLTPLYLQFIQSPPPDLNANSSSPFNQESVYLFRPALPSCCLCLYPRKLNKAVYVPPSSSILYILSNSRRVRSAALSCPFTMALPVVRTLSDCADFTLTVSPYIYQLYDLPRQVLQSYSSPTELLNLYLSTNPVISGFALSLLLAPTFLVLSEINRNYSQVDRCWSILPSLYNAHFTIYAHMSGLPTQRLDSSLAFSVVWSVCSFRHQASL